MNAKQQELYIKGFNHGYALTRHEPGLTAKIIKMLKPTTDYLSGFFNGKEEWELEHSLIQLETLRQLRNQCKNSEQGLENEL